jgi:protease-4
MSLKNLLTEIQTGIWLIETNSPEHYSEIVKQIKLGAFVNEKQEKFYSVIGKEATNRQTGQSEMKDQVAVISMIGEMTKYNSWCSLGAQGYVKEILSAQNNPDIKGIILKIDGPGGNADAIAEFANIKNLITKPVVSLVDKAYSLHYWVAAMFGDKIMMNNNITAGVGSIGAMLSFIKPKDEIIMIRPEESADKNQEFLDALEGNYEKIQAKLSVLAQKFQNGVKLARPNVEESALSGKTYFAEEAIQLGLADEMGSLESAYNWIIAKSEINKLKS